jgi:hypothetical protein
VEFSHDSRQTEVAKAYISLAVDEDVSLEHEVRMTASAATFYIPQSGHRGQSNANADTIVQKPLHRATLI